MSAASLRVVREDGSILPVVLEVAEGRAKVQLVVTPDLVGGLPIDAWLEVAGLPSPSALSTLDGRRLRSSVRRRLHLEPRLAAGDSGAPVLVSLNGRAPGGEPLRVDTSLTLTFAGVLDPASIQPATCPLFPVVRDVRLPTARLCRVSWRCIGDRFDLILDIPPGAGPLQLVLRAFGVHDPVGRPPEPAGLVAELLAP